MYGLGTQAALMFVGLLQDLTLAVTIAEKAHDKDAVSRFCFPCAAATNS